MEKEKKIQNHIQFIASSIFLINWKRNMKHILSSRFDLENVNCHKNNHSYFLVISAFNSKIDIFQVSLSLTHTFTRTECDRFPHHHNRKLPMDIHADPWHIINQQIADEEVVEIIWRAMQKKHSWRGKLRHKKWRREGDYKIELAKRLWKWFTKWQTKKGLLLSIMILGYSYSINYMYIKKKQ